MKLTPGQYEDIQRYADGLMTENEQQAFEKELEQNPLLKEQLAFEQELQLQLTNLSGKEDEIWKWMTEAEATADPLESERLHKRVQQASREWQQQKEGPAGQPTNMVEEATTGARVVNFSSNKKRPYLQLAAAACVVALLGTGIWIWRQKLSTDPDGTGPVVVKNDTPTNKPPDSNGLAHTNPVDTASQKQDPLFPDRYLTQTPQQVFASNYLPDTPPQQKPDSLIAGLTDYERGEYSTLLNTNLDNISKSRGEGEHGLNNADNVKAIGRYYQGMAYLQLDSTDKAIAAFNQVRQSAPEDSLRSKATWYLAMAYLKKGKGNEAKPLLMQLAANNAASPYKLKSAAILKKLK